jgi:hypothetical protein
VLGNPVLPNGEPQITLPEREMLLARYEIVASFGEGPTFTKQGIYRGNRQKIYVLKKRAGRR